MISAAELDNLIFSKDGTDLRYEDGIYNYFLLAADALGVDDRYIQDIAWAFCDKHHGCGVDGNPRPVANVAETLPIFMQILKLLYKLE